MKAEPFIMLGMENGSQGGVVAAKCRACFLIARMLIGFISDIIIAKYCPSSGTVAVYSHARRTSNDQLKFEGVNFLENIFICEVAIDAINQGIGELFQQIISPTFIMSPYSSKNVERKSGSYNALRLSQVSRWSSWIQGRDIK